jgi:hypothetical protein
MFKIILPIIFFIVLICAISYYWDKADDVNKRKIAGIAITILIATLSLTIYLIID